MIWAECEAALNYSGARIPQLPDVAGQMSKTTAKTVIWELLEKKKRARACPDFNARVSAGVNDRQKRC